MDKIAAFCDFYKEQVNYALRLIADGKADDYRRMQYDVRQLLANAGRRS